MSQTYYIYDIKVDLQLIHKCNLASLALQFREGSFAMNLVARF